MNLEQEQDEITVKDQWSIISQFFNENGLVSQQIKSYEHFIDNLPNIVTQQGLIEVEYQPQFKPGMIEEINKIKKYQFKIVDTVQKTVVIQDQKEITPMEARLRDLTYSKPYFFKIELTEIEVEDGKEKIMSRQILHKNIKLCDIPVMIQSKHCNLSQHKDIDENVEKGECYLDQGGYFIVRGSEKVIVAQERMSYNNVFLFKGKEATKPWRTEINSFPNDQSGNQKKFEMQLRYKKEYGFVIEAKIPHTCNSCIPLFVLMRALGMSSDKQILECIFYNLGDASIKDYLKECLELLKPSVLQSAEYLKKEACVQYIGRKTEAIKKSSKNDTSDVLKEGEKALHNFLLPHLGREKHQCMNKAYYIGFMVRRLLEAQMGKQGEDDRDNYSKKRIDMAGSLLTQLFKENYKKFIDNARKRIQSKINDPNTKGLDTLKLEDFFDSKSLTRAIVNGLATGNWGNNKLGDVAKFGVSQVLKRDTSLFATMSHLRRLNAPIKASTKIAKPRQLHNTHFGMICPAETPEGAKIGIVKNFSLMAAVSLGQNKEENQSILNVLDFMEMIKFDVDFDPKKIPQYTKVFLNGEWVGFTANPQIFVDTFLSIRRKIFTQGESNEIDIQVSIYRDIVNQEIRICSDQGRAMRPLLIIDQETNKVKLKQEEMYDLEDDKSNLKLKKFSTLQDQGYIEYLDVEEEEGALIAVDLHHLREENDQNIQYTHLEIHPAMILGVCASVIPFGNHNQGPRNTLQSAMGKQAMCLNATNFVVRLDTLVYILYYCQVPLASSKSLEFITAKDLPIGSNSVVGIACFTGYNQEDSLLFNQSSIDRGFMRSMFYRTYNTCEEKDESSEQEICKPLKYDAKPSEFSDYGKLDEDGIINPETVVQGDLVLVNKVMEMGTSIIDGIEVQQKRKDVSLKSRRTEFGNVDTVLVSNNQNGEKIVKIKIRSKRVPQIGDKFASRHGQKGTVGMCFRQEDFPFNIQGIIPDIIINPHCIPSRMTIGHMIEQLSSKVASLSGIEGNATPFYRTRLHDIAAELHSYGYQKHGNEVLYSPYTGIRLENQIFFGPTFYQRLRHLVDDKMYSRHRGPVETLTRQPTHGRSNHGGLRFGEMERDCIISHGTARFLKERTFEVSDIYRVHVCSNCGLFARADLDEQIFSCKGCDQSDDKKKKNYQIVQVFLPYASKLLMQELMSMHVIPRLKVDVPKSTARNKFV